MEEIFLRKDAAFLDTEPAQLKHINNLPYADDQEDFLDEVYFLYKKKYKTYPWWEKLYKEWLEGK